MCMVCVCREAYACYMCMCMCVYAYVYVHFLGFWSPLSSSVLDTNLRREGSEGTGANGSLVVHIYRCAPPTVCLGANATNGKVHGECMPGAFGPLCGICNETAGYAKSRDGCRKCDHSDTRRSTVEMAAWTGVIGVPIFMTVWYFFALRPLVTAGPDEEQSEKDPRGNDTYARYKARAYFCMGRVSEHPIYQRTLAPALAPVKSLSLSCVKYVVRHNPKDYIKIIVSFYQVSTAFLTNIDVNWPNSVASIWKLFSFVTMELFKLYGYDCMFGGIDYLGRLLLVTTVPMAVILFFSAPWLVSFFYMRHRRSRVFSQFCCSALWVIYLIYPLLCFMTIQGFKCESVEDMYFLAADMKEPCPWKEGERESWIFVWSAASMTIYPIGIPILLVCCLLYLDVPRLARYGKGEAIFQQMISLYLKQREKSICSKVTIHIGGTTKGETAVAERAAALFHEVSGNGVYEVSSQRFLDWLRSIDIEGCDEEEVIAELDSLFTYFDRDGNGILDQEEMLSLVKFLISASGVVHQELNLRMSRHDLQLPLALLSDFEWESFAHGKEELEDAKASGIGLEFLKSFLKKETRTPSSQSSPRHETASSSSLFSSTITNLRLHRALSSPSVPLELENNKSDVERDDVIDALLKRGEMMVKKGIFAIPRLSWKSEKTSHPEEKAVLNMIGFLLDACMFFSPNLMDARKLEAC